MKPKLERACSQPSPVACTAKSYCSHCKETCGKWQQRINGLKQDSRRDLCWEKPGADLPGWEQVTGGCLEMMLRSLASNQCLGNVRSPLCPGEGLVHAGLTQLKKRARVGRTGFLCRHTPDSCYSRAVSSRIGSSFSSTGKNSMWLRVTVF